MDEKDCYDCEYCIPVLYTPKNYCSKKDKFVVNRKRICGSERIINRKRLQNLIFSKKW